jgi:hypothetical protein
LGFSKKKLFFFGWLAGECRSEGGSKSSSMVVLHAGAFAKDGAPNEAQRGELLRDVGGGD